MEQMNNTYVHFAASNIDDAKEVIVHNLYNMPIDTNVGVGIHFGQLLLLPPGL